MHVHIYLTSSLPGNFIDNHYHQTLLSQSKITTIPHQLNTHALRKQYRLIYFSQYTQRYILNSQRLPLSSLLITLLLTHYPFQTTEPGTHAQRPMSYPPLDIKPTSDTDLTPPPLVTLLLSAVQSTQLVQLLHEAGQPQDLAEMDFEVKTNQPRTKAPCNDDAEQQTQHFHSIRLPKQKPFLPKPLAKLAQSAPSLIPQKRSSLSYELMGVKQVYIRRRDKENKNLQATKRNMSNGVQMQCTYETAFISYFMIIPNIKLSKTANSSTVQSSKLNFNACTLLHFINQESEHKTINKITLTGSSVNTMQYYEIHPLIKPSQKGSNILLNIRLPIDTRMPLTHSVNQKLSLKTDPLPSKPLHRTTFLPVHQFHPLEHNFSFLLRKIDVVLDFLSNCHLWLPLHNAELRFCSTELQNYFYTSTCDHSTHKYATNGLNDFPLLQQHSNGKRTPGQICPQQAPDESKFQSPTW
jgi:hypothetical protein